jgi:tetratricopeptide (TPR) repeat protein
MTAITAAYLSFLFTAPKVEITVDAKNGEIVTGERAFRATVAAGGQDVTQVEFYVGDELRDSDTTTPYIFRIDSLAETDGPLKLRFKAYTADGKSGEKVLPIVIDNGLGKGAQFHLDQGEAFLRDGKPKEALTSGRIALKIDDKSVAARIILSRANLALGVFDQAQRFAEDALAKEPSNVIALDLLAGINLRRSFATINREGGDRASTILSIKSALKQAVEARRKALDALLDKQQPPTLETAKQYADVAIKASRYSLAIQALNPAFKANLKDSGIANRLAFAQIRSGRDADALRTMSTHQRYATPDAYGFALIAVLEDGIGTKSASDDAIKQGLLADPDDLGLKTAQAFIALRNGRTNSLVGIVNDLNGVAGSRTEVAYYLFSANTALRRFEPARKAFADAVLAEPANYDAYIETANAALKLVPSAKKNNEKGFLYDTARAYYETALVARPESAEALSGLVIVNLYQGKTVEAVDLGESATRADPGSAVAQFALAGAYSKRVSEVTKAANGASSPEAVKLSGLAEAAIKSAGKLDDRNLGGHGIPRETDILKYLSTFGRVPVLTAPQ